MTILHHAEQYLALGIQPLPLPFKSKKPELIGWTSLRLTAEQLPKHFNGSSNIGGLMGEPSNCICDVDLDWSEVEQLARQLLPKSWAFGRSNHLRHVLIKAPGSKTARFDAPVSIAGMGDKRRIVELLSTGAQVVLPGSVHPDGSRIEWLTAPNNGTALAELPAAELLSVVSALAGAALLARVWQDLEGTRHEVMLALAGALYHANWPQPRIEKVLLALLQVVNDPEKRDRATAIRSTLDKANAGDPICGLPRLADLLPNDVVACLKKWWQLGNTPSPLTFGGMTSTEWPELLEFESNLPASHNAYPVEKLGPLLGGAVNALVHRSQVPVALAAQSILAAASTTVHMYYNVECDGRIIPLSLWLVLVGEPGERKTSSDEIAFSRIYKRMKESVQRYRVALENWKTTKEEGGEVGPRPRSPLWLLRDTTTEGLLKTLDHHWPALTLTNSDAGAWLGGYSMREGRDTATASMLSTLWSGTFHAQARASLAEPLMLENRRLALSLMLQPELAARFFESRTLSGQGFLSRCLPAFPASTIGTRKYRRTQPDNHLEAFYAAQDRLLLRLPDINLDTGELQLEMLHLESEALEVWISYYDEFETALAGEYRSIREAANKAPEQILRLAGVRAALEAHSSITCQHINDCAELIRWHMGEWLEMQTRLMAYRREVVLPKQVLDWMTTRQVETGQDNFSLREIYTYGPRSITRNQPDNARALLAELMRRGYVRLQGKQYQLRPQGED